jgi:pimeloyl-ACP methyl ester carboxylesterase
MIRRKTVPPPRKSVAFPAMPIVTDILARHQASGRRFRAAGVESFVLDQSEGEPVVCLHGVPASSFLYRKLVPELAARGRLRPARPGPGRAAGRSVICGDFAFDVNGYLYCATDPFQTVVKVAPDGTTELLLTAEDGLNGPTATCFGRRGDGLELYVTNAAHRSSGNRRCRFPAGRRKCDASHHRSSLLAGGLCEARARCD